MKDEDIFIEVEGYKLPEPLSKEETLELFKSSKFDDESRTKIIEHNIRLVFYRIKNKFNELDYDKKELVSIGILGLVNAVDTFDSSKGYEFTTYAIKCIDTEIFKLIKKVNRTKNNISIEEIVSRDDEDFDNSLKLESMLSDKTDFREEIEKYELFTYLRSLVDKLNERDKKVIMLYFGFYDNKCYTQEEIANIIKISRSNVSGIISSTIRKFSFILKNKGLIELHSKEYVRVNKNR